ncbi:MAG: choice-of-anchor I family protein [Candidatus Coproplasma sp.]
MSKKKRIVAVISAAAMALGVAAFAGCSRDNGGATATSVQSVAIDTNGDLIVTFSDGTTRNAGKVKGENGTNGTNGTNGIDGTNGADGADGIDGADGVSVQDVYVNGNGELIVIFSDGSKHNAGSVRQTDLTLNKVAQFNTGFSSADGGVAEIVKYNKDNGKVYLVNGKMQTLDIISLGVYAENADELQTDFNEATDRIDFSKMVAEHSADFEAGFAVGDITSVAVNNELKVVAVALQGAEYYSNGAVVLIDYDGNYVKAYACGVQPDMITFAGNLVLTANEGEPRMGYADGTADPKGSVTIIDLSAGVQSGEVTNATFDGFDSQREALVNAGVLIKKGANPSADFEPEYITVSGNYAYVSLQEANAIATLDLQTRQFIKVDALGFKDHSKEENALDLLDDGKIEITTQNVYGVYMPDGIDAFELDGVTYIATANEGDAREWGDYSGITKMTIGSTKVEILDNNEWDGLDADKAYVLGGRSFSVFRADDMSLVYDSGDAIERAVANSEYADYFNCSNDKTTLDGRSKKKGPEPETVLVRYIDGRPYAFVGLERVSGVMTFDLTNIKYGEATFKDYTSTRDYTQAMAGDVAPEGMDYIEASEKTGGKNVLVVANENSGTVAFYAVEGEKKSYEMHSTFVEAPAQNADHLLIYAVGGAGTKVDGPSTNDFIAIKNPTDTAIELTGYKLRYAVGGATATEWQELALTGTIEADQVYIVRCAAGNPAGAFSVSRADIEWTSLSISNKTFSLQLVNGDSVVDALGADADLTDNEVGEGTVITEYSKQIILIRVNDGDTNNNSLDFESVSLKGLAADSEIVITYMAKLGLTA